MFPKSNTQKVALRKSDSRRRTLWRPSQHAIRLWENIYVFAPTTIASGPRDQVSAYKYLSLHFLLFYIVTSNVYRQKTTLCQCYVLLSSLSGSSQWNQAESMTSAVWNSRVVPKTGQWCENVVSDLLLRLSPKFDSFRKSIALRGWAVQVEKAQSWCCGLARNKRRRLVCPRTSPPQGIKRASTFSSLLLFIPLERALYNKKQSHRRMTGAVFLFKNTSASPKPLLDTLLSSMFSKDLSRKCYGLFSVHKHERQHKPIKCSLRHWKTIYWAAE